MSVNSPLDQRHDLRARLWNIEARLRTLERGGAGISRTGVLHIGEALEIPNSPPTTGGGFFYVEGGALWFLGGNGTLTNVGSA